MVQRFVATRRVEGEGSRGSMMTKKKKVGIIGAGASGLTAIKSAVEEGKPYQSKIIPMNL